MIKWVKSRKLAVIAEIDSGQISEADALQKYELSKEELDMWRATIALHGEARLRVTNLTKYRNK